MRIRYALLALVGLIHAVAPAQPESGAIIGTVVDRASKEPLPSANLQILSTAIGASTDIDGKFRIPTVPFGTYQIRVSLVGYEPLLLSDIVVRAGTPVQIRAELEVSAIGLETVEVTASYFQKTPDARVSVQRLSYEEIRRSPGGFEDVVRAISVFPGVAQAEPGRNDLVVRGGAPSENLYVVDNLEIPNINHFGTQGSGGGPLSYINLDFVAETAFSTGGFGARYGDRLSSVLNIDLREGRDDQLGGKATLAATQFGLNLEGPVSERGNFIFSARRSYLDFIFKANGFTFVPEYWDFLGRLQYRLDRSNTITFLGIGAIDRVQFFDDDAEARLENSGILGTDQDQYATGLTWQHLFGFGFATVTLGRTFVRYNGVQRDSLLNPIFTNQSREGETTLKSDMVMKPGWGNGEIAFGAAVKRVRFNTDLALPDYTTSFGDTITAVVQDLQEIGYKGSVYTQYSHRFLDRLALTVGARGDYFDLIANPWSFSPRGSLSYSFTALTSFNFSAGRFHQSPSSIWLATNPDNRNLEQIQADQYVAGVEHLVHDDFKVRVEGFYKRYTDYPASVDRTYLVLANTGAGFGGTDDNFASYGLDHLVSEGVGRAYGIEFLLQKKLSDIPLYGIVSLTMSRTFFTALDGIERRGAFDQPFILNLSGGWKISPSWEVSTRFRLASGRPYTPFNADGTQDVARYNAERLPVSHSLDLRADRRWNFTGWNLVTYIDIQNVYNNKTVGSVRWDPVTRSVRSSESGIGILPSVGISAEF